MYRRLTFPALFLQSACVAALLLVYHFILRHWMLETGLRLGAISHKLVPLYAYWRPHWKGWLVVPLAVVGAYLLWLHRTRVAASLDGRRAIAWFMSWFVAIVTSVAILDSGPRSLVRPLVERADLEYFGAIDRVGSVREFFRDFASQSTTMPMHAQVHPPGAVLFLYWATRLPGDPAWIAAASIIVFTALTVPIVYAWGRRVSGAGVARRAAALFVLMPSVVLFTATSMDGPFAVPLIASMWLFWCAVAPDESNAVRGRSIFCSILFATLAGLAATVAALMTYSVTVSILFCGVAACVCWWWQPAARRAIEYASVAALGSFTIAHLLLWWATGFDPIEMFLTAVANSNGIMHGTRHESLVRYLNISVANLVVFFVAAGLATSVVWWPHAVTTLRAWRARDAGYDASNRASDRMKSNRETNLGERLFLVVSLVTLAITASVPVYVLEVERVWLFLMPIVAIPVASRLACVEAGQGKTQSTASVAKLLALQTIVTEILLTTYW